MRTPEQLLKAYEKATKEAPLVIARDESDNFCKAMKLSNIKEDIRLGKQLGKLTIVDGDKLLANGVLSPIDQKTVFHNRKDWAEHLKRHNCIEFGNDFNKSTEKMREIKGDFDCREQLTKATHQIAEKYGH